MSLSCIQGSLFLRESHLVTAVKESGMTRNLFVYALPALRENAAISVSPHVSTYADLSMLTNVHNPRFSFD